MFSSFDPDVCTMLSLKQPRYPVFFLTHSGHPNAYVDARYGSLNAAI
jgi:glycerophosphodiester phosphodiesterase